MIPTFRHAGPAERSVAAIGTVDDWGIAVPWRGAAGYADRRHRRRPGRAPTTASGVGA